MANASELLRLIIQADTQGAVKGLEAVGHSADKNLGNTQNRVDKLAGNLQKFGAVAVSAGAVAAVGLFKAGEAASDLGEQVSQSEQIFGDAAGGIGDFAKDAAGSLGQSERAAREAANTFGLFFTNAGKSQEEAAGMSVELSKLASDMASFKNTSPEQAVEALGAALRGESEPIRQYGVMLDDATLKQRALSMGLVESTTGVLPPAIKMQAAYAEILAQTSTIQGDFERTSGGLANQQRILAAEFENAKAAIGQGALPVLTKLTGVAADAASGFASLDQSTGGAVGTLATLATGGLLVGGGLSVAIGSVLKMRDNLSHLKGPLTNATGGLSTLGEVTAGLGGAAVIGGAIMGLESMRQAAKHVTVDIDALNASLAENSDASKRQILETLGAAEAFGTLDDYVSDVAKSDVVAAEKMLEVAEASGVSADKIAHLRDIVNEKRQADIQGAENQQEYAAQTDAATGSTDAYAGAQETAAEKVERLKDELESATEAITKNYDAMNESTNLLIDYEAGIDDLTQSLKDNGTTLDISTDKGRTNVRQIESTGGAIAALIQKRYEETGSVNQAAAAGDLYVGNLKNQLREAGFTEDAIAQLIAQMHLTPEEIRTNVLADVAQASANISDYQRLINNTPRLVETIFNGYATVRPNRVDRNADGTSHFRGGLTWVGERGPEIVELPRGTAIHDAVSSKAMVGGGSGGGVTNIFNITAIDPASAARAVKDALSGAGIRGVG